MTREEIIIVTGDEKHWCSICDDSANYEIKINQAVPDKKMYLCDSCLKIINQKASLVRKENRLNGSALETIRLSRNFSTTMLARKLGISRQAISEWECSGRPIPDDRLEHIAKIFNVPVAYFGSMSKQKQPHSTR